MDERGRDRNRRHGRHGVLPHDHIRVNIGNKQRYTLAEQKVKMSRVHDALRRAEQAGLAPEEPAAAPPPRVEEPRSVEFIPVNGGPTALPPIRLNLSAGMLNDVLK